MLEKIFHAWGEEVINLSSTYIPRIGIQIGRDAFIELLYRNYLLVRRVRSKRKTTLSNHWMRKYPNLIRDYIPTAPNQL